MRNAFANLLKDWRGRRRLSQLGLALSADVSARHIAFLETGRSRPSRDMVVRLSDAMEIPRAERNVLLSAAGFSAGYLDRSLDAREMDQVRAALDWTLDRHAPYPAMALDRHWILIRANEPAIMFFGSIGLKVGGSMLDLLTDSPQLRQQIVNWPEVARHVHGRLRTESAHLGGDPALDAAADRLLDEFDVIPDQGAVPLPAIVPTIFRAGETTLSFFSTIAQFGTAEDITLADLKIELFFPADEATRQMLLGA